MSGDAANNPLVIYRRGVYFDGVSKFLELTGFYLHHSFTLELWIRVHNNASVFSISKLIDGSDDHLTLGLVPTDRLNFKYAPATYDLIDTNTSLSKFKWHYIVTSVSWNRENYVSTVTILNDTVQEVQGTFAKPVIDNSTYPHYLGAEIIYQSNVPEQGVFFQGFIWKMCMS